MTYGETVVTLPYVREHWAPAFELLGADLLLGDLHQVMLTLRRSALDSPPSWNGSSCTSIRSRTIPATGAPRWPTTRRS